MLLEYIRRAYRAFASRNWIVPTPAVVMEYYAITSTLAGFFGLASILLAVTTLHEGPLLVSGAHIMVDVTWPLFVYSVSGAFAFTALAVILRLSAWWMVRLRTKAPFQIFPR